MREHEDVKVFAFEGEGGFTTGASHETINSAWGLGLGNLIYFWTGTILELMIGLSAPLCTAVQKTGLDPMVGT